MDQRPDSRFDAAWRDALREGHMRAPWPSEAGVEQPSAAADPAAAAATDADTHRTGWADVLRRAEQASPLAQVEGTEPARAAANDAPPVRSVRRGSSARRLGAACLAAALAGVIWWQVPSPDVVPQGDDMAPSGMAPAQGSPRGTTPSGPPTTDLPRVQVDAPAREALRWVAELERLGSIVQSTPAANGDVTVEIAVADESRRMAVNLWLSTFDQQLDGQGRLRVRLATPR